MLPTKTHHSLNPSKAGRLLLAMAPVLLVAHSGCSLKPGDQALVQIAIPKAISAPESRIFSLAQNQGLEWVTTGQSNDEFSPTSLDEFDCYGLNISGPGIARHPHFRDEVCSSNQIPAQILVGLVPASGGVIEALVPAGANRVFQIFGLKKKLAECPKLEDIVAHEARGGKASDWVEDGPALELGRVRTDVFTDVSLQLKVSFDPNSKKEMFAMTGMIGMKTISLRW